MVATTAGSSYLERPRATGLAEVVDLILDKGLVIDVFVRVSLLGLELLTVDARIVVASIDTYLRYAEAVDRLVLEPASSKQLTDLVGDAQESGAKGKVRGAIDGVKESLGVGNEAEAEQRPRRAERGPSGNGRGRK
jgi:gas vesicle structural protein